MLEGFWQGKRVLVTGHTGFKGGWLSVWLQKLQAEVVGIALDPLSGKSLYQVADVSRQMTSLRQDIRDRQALFKLINAHQPEVIFHLAAQPLVRDSYHYPVETWETNVMGSINVLEAARSTGSVKAVVMVTSDKCYQNNEWEWGYRENDPLGGYDPYSSSKAAAEIAISAWRDSFLADSDVAVASVRAGNVIGGGDWAKDRLIPDILQALTDGKSLTIRYPQAVRPWQHVLEPLYGYLMLAQQLFTDGKKYVDAWNFGPNESDVQTVKWIVNTMTALWGENIDWNLEAGKSPHEASYLKLDCSRARQRLGWSPRWHLQQALEHIISWHQSELQGQSMREKCMQQIDEYLAT